MDFVDARVFADLKNVVLEGYVNLALISDGAATAQDYGVGDPATKFILEALRKIEDNR